MLIQLIPEYRDYVWGGQRLRPGQLTAEVWVIYENDRVAAGPYEGRSLAELAGLLGVELLGKAGMQRGQGRFPLLIKLLDCAAWLSVQVHPNDEQALELEGPGFFGKMEAWHVLDAEAGAQVIAGVKPGTTREDLAKAIRTGKVLDWVEYHSLRPGDTVMMPTGTIHALGPGLMMYEVQQTSNLTYRVYDWDRPPTPQRPLHIEQSLHVVNPAQRGEVKPLPALAAPAEQTLVECPYFRLEMVSVGSAPHRADTGGQSFHALTVLSGECDVSSGGERVALKPYESVLISASSPAYQVNARAGCRLLRASVPGEAED